MVNNPSQHADRAKQDEKKQWCTQPAGLLHRRKRRLRLEQDQADRLEKCGEKSHLGAAFPRQTACRSQQGRHTAFLRLRRYLVDYLGERLPRGHAIAPRQVGADELALAESGTNLLRRELTQ
ncbi:MAG: hypothetical protein O2957_05840 [Verrucomicrobia bacterium]|nr:hypothetical protein [Verrucomicrobiota bacterium]